MNPVKTLKVSSIVVMLLGSIHLAATPFVFGLINSSGKPDIDSLYMFVMVGVAVIFAGWLQKFLVQKLNEDKSYEKILTGSIVFMLILGIGAAGSMTTNPFAYITLMVALVEIFALRAYLKSNSNE